ncbi:MAG: DUF1543 domain-containing protein [Ginsengibacter sp.]
MNMQPKLFMLLIGCKPAGRNTEQHDVFFTIASSLADTISSLKKFWPEAKETLHVDAWREVNHVDGHNVLISLNENNVLAAGMFSERLYFVNLGGYKPEEFEEFHYKMIVIAPEKGDAIRQSKLTAFYKHCGFKGASSHVDDKYGIDVDDVYGIEDILPGNIKQQYRIDIIKTNEVHKDELHLGYYTIKKLELM